MTIDELQSENWKLKSLLRHAYVHSGYRDCGFLQMTTEQKKLFVKLLEEWDHPASAERLRYFISEPSPEVIPQKPDSDDEYCPGCGVQSGFHHRQGCGEIGS